MGFCAPLLRALKENVCTFLPPFLQSTLFYGEGENTGCCIVKSLMIKETTGGVLIDSMKCKRCQADEESLSLFFGVFPGGVFSFKGRKLYLIILIFF